MSQISELHIKRLNTQEELDEVDRMIRYAENMGVYSLVELRDLYYERGNLEHGMAWLNRFIDALGAQSEKSVQIDLKLCHLCITI